MRHGACDPTTHWLLLQRRQLAMMCTHIPLYGLHYHQHNTSTGLINNHLTVLICRLARPQPNSRLCFSAAL